MAMAKLLFRLRNAPEDEIADVHQLLLDSHIDYFETSAGKWGISMPAIWVREDEDFARARELLDAYQQSRVVRLREEQRERVSRGEQETLLQRLQSRPVTAIAYCAIVLVILYFSILPFYSMVS